jgi:hypothetical protein
MYVILKLLLDSEHFSQEVIVNVNVVAIVVQFCVEFGDAFSYLTLIDGDCAIDV